jgi:hypothetical protein
MLLAQQFNGLCAEPLAAAPIGNFHEVNLQTFPRFRDTVTGIQVRVIDNDPADDFFPGPSEGVEQV